jgi:signal transduction histidine kinase
VRAVVHAHGGTVAAKPVPGGGLAVTVHLPIA